MTPKSGSPGSIVAPAAPVQAEEADNADPGEVSAAKAEQRQTQSGKYGSEKAPVFKPPSEEEAKELTWIEIEMVGEDDKPIPGETYKITLADGRVTGGTLDDKGFARVEGIEPGTCKVTFPNLDKDAWQKL